MRLGASVRLRMLEHVCGRARCCNTRGYSNARSYSNPRSSRASIRPISPCAPGHRVSRPSPTLSPTDPVPRGLLTLCPAASSGPGAQGDAHLPSPPPPHTHTQTQCRRGSSCPRHPLLLSYTSPPLAACAQEMSGRCGCGGACGGTATCSGPCRVTHVVGHAGMTRHA